MRSWDVRASMKHYRNQIGGDWVESVRTFENRNPIDGSVVAQVHEADGRIVDAAVRAARQALSGPWSKLAVADRAAML